MDLKQNTSCKASRSLACTCMLCCPAPPCLVEGSQGAYGGPEDAPAEHGHRVRTDQLAQEAPLTAAQQRNYVRPHVVRVLLTEVLRVCIKKSR